MRWYSFEKCASAIGTQQPALFATLCERGDQTTGERLAQSARYEIGPASLATILYTSGTTGEPKGVMLSQGNLASNACSTIAQFGYEPDQVRLNFLPLSHIFARTCDLYGWLVDGSRLAIAESRETVLADCETIKPTCLNGVPYFYDKVYRGLCIAGKQNTPRALHEALGGGDEELGGRGGRQVVAATR